MYEDDYDPDLWRPARRSQTLEFVSMLLGIFSLIGCMVFYIAIPCGALAILFAFLSRGKGKPDGKTRFAVILGAAGIVSSVLMTAFLFYQLLTNSMIRNRVRYLFNQYAKEYGLDVDFDSAFGFILGEESDAPDSEPVPEEDMPGNTLPWMMDGEDPADDGEDYYNSSQFWQDLFDGKISPSQDGSDYTDPVWAPEDGLFDQLPANQA